jgi:hypothetical protein
VASITTRVTPSSANRSASTSSERVIVWQVRTSSRPPARPALARDPYTAGQLGLAHVQGRHPLDDLIVVVGLLQHPGLPGFRRPNRWLPAGAAGQQADLIRVLEATVKGPGATPSTRLINGLRRPRRSGVSGQPPQFSFGNGRRRSAAPRLIS